MLARNIEGGIICPLGGFEQGSRGQDFHRERDRFGGGLAQQRALLARARAQTDAAARAALLREAEAMMLDDVPLIPIYFYAAQHLVKPQVAVESPCRAGLSALG